MTMYRKCLDCGNTAPEDDFRFLDEPVFRCLHCDSTNTLGVSDSPLLRGEVDVSTEGGQWW